MHHADSNEPDAAIADDDSVSLTYTSGTECGRRARCSRAAASDRAVRLLHRRRRDDAPTTSRCTQCPSITKCAALLLPHARAVSGGDQRDPPRRRIQRASSPRSRRRVQPSCSVPQRVDRGAAPPEFERATCPRCARATTAPSAMPVEILRRSPRGSPTCRPVQLLRPDRDVPDGHGRLRPEDQLAQGGLRLGGPSIKSKRGLSTTLDRPLTGTGRWGRSSTAPRTPCSATAIRKN